MTEKEKLLIRPYGDRKDDGVVQISFVLPVPASEQAKEAAAAVAKKLGLSHVLVSAMEKAGEDYSFFVVYGRTHMQLDFNAIEVPTVVHRKHGFDDMKEAIKRDLGRRIVVVGACIGISGDQPGIAGRAGRAGGASQGRERRRHPGIEGRHPTRRAQGGRAVAHRGREAGGDLGEDHLPLRRAARRSQDGPGIGIRRRIRAGHQAERRG
jgi:beta-lysine 5,6-aminomutase beta subunit